MVDIRKAESIAETSAAMDLLDGIFGSHRGWNSTRDRQRELYRADPGLLAIALDDIRIIGAGGCDGTGVINVVGVDSDYRGRGIARKIVEEAEGILRSRGARSVGLGSVDDAVDFYLKCGYVPQLLIQFAPEAEDPNALVDELLAGPLRDNETVRSEYEGSPQLWVQSETIDLEFKQQIEAVAPGIVGGYVMSKDL